MDNIGAQIPWDLYDHFWAYFNSSMPFFQEPVPVTFLKECLLVAGDCLVPTAEKYLKIYVYYPQPIFR